MASSTAELFQDIADQVGVILDYYFGEHDTDRAPEFAGMIQNAKLTSN